MKVSIGKACIFKPLNATVRLAELMYKKIVKLHKLRFS